MTDILPLPPGAAAGPEPATRLGLAWLRLSTGAKTMLILAAALLPPGFIAVLASIESAAVNRAAHHAETRVVAEAGAARLNAAIGRAAITMRATATALALNPLGSASCRRTVESLAQTLGPGTRFALFGENGALLCATDSFRPLNPSPPTGSTEYQAGIDPAESGVSIVIRGATGATTAVGLLTREMLAGVERPTLTSGPAQVSLVAGPRRLELVEAAGGTLGHEAVASAPLASGQLRLDLAVRAPPIRPLEIVTILLPIVMLLAAATVGWLVLDQLILRPLALLQRAVAHYQPGSTSLALPPLSTPSQEIRRLSGAFQHLAATVAQHEADLEAGLARQTRLTREVHHRVKNNLQVVASLINLHARGARSAETMAAYASIQRRVDALAVVHRNHYAEYEQNRGVALRPLIQELAGNLRTSAGGGPGGLAIVVAIEPLHVTQDVAVAIAFLVTEVVELAMLSAPGSSLGIRLVREEGARARLTIASPALRASGELDARLAERFGRVIEGLARQLRTSVTRDAEMGSYSFLVAVLD